MAFHIFPLSASAWPISIGFGHLRKRVIVYQMIMNWEEKLRNLDQQCSIGSRTCLGYNLGPAPY